MTPRVVTTIAEVRAAVAEHRRAGKTIGCVPTMGALHAGHIELVRIAKQSTAFVVTTIFVNPTQFGPKEDFSKYPRTLDADVNLLAAVDCDLVFSPSVDEMYPEAFTYVDIAKLGDHLCGPRRPGHFRGVCTVVLKLFNIVLPDVAVFGAKDAQQARIIVRMVRDLNVPVSVTIAPTVREADGLAMSSRNRYLSPDERAVAPQIYRALQAIAASGEPNVAKLEAELHAKLTAIPGARVDYASIVDDETLQPIATIARPALVAVAVFLGTTRLIDNVTLSPLRG
ncbi:pantoate--beta-alanine ligase [Limnoglobus roseus]|uniref:Pantothenate synthetase n=1 Tax=Limnoglobus roseus TaxID=2598579 RepID=A0A5C1A3E1_9BACT|nr:pantoate--beta-alanine ligase [Limnoglobus roseus]QEL13601.1 pantoate--beta-alanine ligase [Limnoglobus roseus]